MRLEITTFSLNEFMNEISEFYADFAEMQEKKLTMKLLDEDIMVAWDKGRVKRCVVILLENAIKYTNSGDEITVTVFKKDRLVKLEVKDTGIGIKEDEQDRIFDRFFRSSEVRTSDKEGSGIGLSLLRSIAYSLGIKVSASSVYQKGSVFTLVIPIAIKE